MAGLRRLDAAAVRRWCATALADLRARRQEIDDINVYPVPDGDAGTNMVATMEAVHESLRDARTEDLAGTMRALTRGALTGARGNSGVILSQVLSGFADVLGPLRSAGGEKLKEALDAAVSKAYAAVTHPAEGTILTVARGAAQAARAVEGDDFAVVIRAAATGAREALVKTTEQLPALKAAGVVDAGGRGLVVVLEALARVMGAAHDEAGYAPPPLVARDASALASARESGSAEFGYEVQFLLDAADGAITPLKRRLARLGDSLLVVGGKGLYNVHVHVNDVGAALELAVRAGRPHRVEVTRFADQIAAQLHHPQHHKADTRTVVAIASGAGLCRLFGAAGAVVVRADSDLDDLKRIVGRLPADEILLLPNAAHLHSVAADVMAASQRCRVHVIPTRSAVQGLAALAVHDPACGLADDVIAMTTAAGATSWGNVTLATEDAQTSAGPCRAGDVLGLVEGDAVVVGSRVTDVAIDVLDRMLAATGELVTLVAGQSLSPKRFELLIASVQAAHPVVQVDAHRGDQAGDALLIGVE